jgi:pyruvate,orthophosphate dikinase
LRISKYQETKDKNYLQQNILKEIRNYCLNETWRDPKSIMFCANAGLNYVSCSPYRVPIARLAAAQAQLIKNS